MEIGCDARGRRNESVPSIDHKQASLGQEPYSRLPGSNAMVQIVFVGPPGDLYGRYAATKLQKLSERFPDRIHVTAAFVKAPRCLFVGADWCLCPSRDEPFGYVDVEFAEAG